MQTWWPALLPLLKEIPGIGKQRCPTLRNSLLSGKLQQLHYSNFTSRPPKRKANKVFLFAFLSANSSLILLQEDWAVSEPLRTNNKHQQRQLPTYAALAAKSCDRCDDVGTVSPSWRGSPCYYLYCGCGKLGLLETRCLQPQLYRGKDKTKLSSNAKPI